MTHFYGHRSATHCTPVESLLSLCRSSPVPEGEFSFRPPGFSPYVGREERGVQVLDYCRSGLLKGHGVVRQRRFSGSDWMYLCFETWVGGFNLVDWSSTLSLFLEIFVNHLFVCLSSASAAFHLPIGRIMWQLLFWNRFHANKIAETKLEHFAIFLDILQFINIAVTLLQGKFKA